MVVQTKSTFYRKILMLGPILMLFVAVLNEYDFNYLNYKYFSFNFPFILIFYWSLRRTESLGYGFVFIAGLFNDVVSGFPIGISGLTYLMICGFAAYLRNITLRPNLLNDWLFFLFTILVVSSINYSLLILFFSLEFNYYEISANILFTFLLYYLFGYLFDIYDRLVFRVSKDA